MKTYLSIFAIFYLKFPISVILKDVRIDFEICKYYLKTKCFLKSLKAEILLSNGTNFKLSTCICRDMYVRPTWTDAALQTYANFYSNLIPFDIYFKNRKPVIMNKKLPIFDQSYFSIFRAFTTYTFRNVKGFDVNSFDEPIIIYSLLEFSFYDSSLAFFSNGRRLKTCLDFPTQTRSLFQMFKSNRPRNTMDIQFSAKKFQPVCPLAFANASNIDILAFNQLINTFYKTSIPTFLVLPQHITQINANINCLTLYGYGGITLNGQIIDPNVFNRTKEFYFYIEILKIESGLFKALKNVKIIQIYMYYWRKLAYKGIDWIYDLNSEIRVNLSDSAMIREYSLNGSSFVTIYCKRRQNEIVEGLQPTNVFPNEDICVYDKFPFEQMVIWFFDEVDLNYTKISCTFVWLVQPELILNGLKKRKGEYRSRHRKTLEIYIDIFNKCDFNKR